MKIPTLKYILLGVFICLTSWTFAQESAVTHLTKEEFQQKVWNYTESPQEWVYSGKKPCIIDFYANWCGPCRQLGPKLEELAEEYKGKIFIYKVNIDQQKELAALFGVKSIPAILFVPKNSQPQMALGNLPKETLVNIIDSVLLVKHKR
ncbi:MAG: thioredoxin [Bacteroidales bacterium]|nr:thioredoxin [Bacteroidales bacterium]